MKGPQLLQAHAGILRTRVGACWPGERAVFRGCDLHGELRNLSWVELYLFGITGRRFTAAQIELVNALWVYTSYPDARLWNNRIAALAASARSSANLGVAAALAVSEATIYGGRAGLRAFGFLQHIRQRVAQGDALEATVQAELQSKRIYGYGRPINSHDERIPWLMDLVRRLHLDGGEYVKLAFAVEPILVARNPGLRMNYAALHAALIADMGLSAREYQLLRIPTFLAGMAPCVVEAAAKPEGAIFPVPCEKVVYEGAAPRPWR
jgi:hypothetical protein